MSATSGRRDVVMHAWSSRVEHAGCVTLGHSHSDICEVFFTFAYTRPCRRSTSLPQKTRRDGLVSCRAIARRYKESFSSIKTELGHFKMMAFLLEEARLCIGTVSSRLIPVSRTDHKVIGDVLLLVASSWRSAEWRRSAQG